MSLSRAFTSRKLRGGNDLMDRAKMPERSHTLREKISAPTQLLHTTNMLSYNAPDLPRSSRSNSLASKHSDTDADSQTTADSTPPTSPDVSASPLEPNHLSCYFLTTGASLTKLQGDAPAPAIPKRSPSHTKKNSYDAIARQRSVSRQSRDSEHSVSARNGQVFSRPPSTSTRASSASHASTALALKQSCPLPPPPPPAASSTMFNQYQAKEAHPFGQELAQVTELAEEYSTSRHLDTIDEEQQYLNDRGLMKFSPDVYLSSIQGLSATFFPERNHSASVAPLWI